MFNSLSTVDPGLGRGFAAGSPFSPFQTIGANVHAAHNPPHHAMDIVETPEAYELHADAPGMKPEDIKVEVVNNTLTVCGEHNETRKLDKRGRVWRKERTTREFSRTFIIPDDASKEGISATLEHGELKVVVAKHQGGSKPPVQRIAVTYVESGMQA